MIATGEGESYHIDDSGIETIVEVTQWAIKTGYKFAGVFSSQPFFYYLRKRLRNWRRIDGSCFYGAHLMSNGAFGGLFDLQRRFEFLDNYRQSYLFRHAFFSRSNGALPPPLPGCYMLLSRNLHQRHGIGSHSVLYVGESECIQERMKWHARDGARFRNVRRWPFEVLYLLEEDLLRHKIYRGRGQRERFEEKLHFLFVPSLSDQHPQAVGGGRKALCTDQVFLDRGQGKLMWRKPPVRPIAQAGLRASSR